MGIKRADVKPTDDVFLTIDCYPETAEPGVPQQLLTIGAHKAKDLPDFVFERGYVNTLPKPEAETEPEKPPANSKSKPPPEPT